MLVNAYSPSIKTNDCYFVGAQSSDVFVSSVKARSTDSLRFINSFSTINVLSKIASFLDVAYDPSLTQGISSKLQHTIEGKNGIYQILEKSDDDNYHETIAYRIKKERAGTTIQDIWMYNDFPTLNRITFASQIPKFYMEKLILILFMLTSCAQVSNTK